MKKIQIHRAHLVLPFVFCFLVITLGSACWHTRTDSPPPADNNLSAQSSPTVEPSKSTDTATDPLTESDPALAENEAWILSTQNIVNLTRKGSNTPEAVKFYTGFRLGDLLEVARDSFATALCQKGTCVLGLGNYHSCCTVPCQGQVSMIRREDSSEMPLIFRKELPPEEEARLATAEQGLRGLNLGPVTTQFLVTTLYTNWRIKEANQELDKLSVQLVNPEAKQELQQLYTPALTKTGNMHLKYNRLDDAKKMYQLTLSRSSVEDNPRERAAAHVGLAQTYEVSGDKTEAITNLEDAREIYVKQGDTNAAASTEKRIEKNRTIRSVDEIKRTRPLIQKSP